MLFENYKDDLELYIANHYVEKLQETIDLDEVTESMSLDEAPEPMSFSGVANSMSLDEVPETKGSGNGLDKKNFASASAARSLEDVVNNLDRSFMELVFSFADQKGITDVQLQKKANLDRKAFSKLKCGTTKNPSKSTALALAIALELNLDETKDLLSRAGFALSPCSKQDVIVQFFIEREAYDIYEINVALYEHDEKTLGTQV